MPQVIRLGTRRSLLAQTQSQWVADEIQKRHPSIKVELVGIETKGDKILDRPLQDIPGKDFFVAEIDEALLRGEVDFTVHSLKDLSIDRPANIVTGAIPKREPSHDIAIFHSRIFSSQGPIRIGTSSPRRRELIPNFLKKSLPGTLSSRDIQWKDIRGNVTTRLEHLHRKDGDPKQLDGVVLALAGLNRLGEDATAYDLLKGTLKQVLPLSLCPSAPGQGALSVECHKDQELIYKILQTIHDSETEELVTRERAEFKRHGGGCHQRFGSSWISHTRLGLLGFTRGITQKGNPLNTVHWNAPPRPRELDPRRFWNGSEISFEREAIAELSSTPPKSVLFVSHANAIPESWISLLGKSSCSNQSQIWCSGWKTWEKLAQANLWVQGCSEQMGIEAIKDTMKSPTLGLPLESDWTVLTHEGAAEFNPPMKSLATYRLKRPLTASKNSLEQLKNAHFVYWTSPAQFEELHFQMKQPHVHHSCGPGRTAEALLKKGIGPIQVFPSQKEWIAWLSPSV